MSSYEHIPRLRIDDLEPNDQVYVTSWQVNVQGLIVPPLEAGQREVLLWHGVFSNDGETPVFAAPIRCREVNPNPLKEWYYGVARQNAIEASPDPLNAYLDAALHPAQSLRETLGVLACMIPLQQLVGSQG